MTIVKLILEENQVAVLLGDPKVDMFIDQVTRFKARGFEHSEKYKAGDWDGFTRLYNRGKHIFPFGLLETVEMALIINDVDYEIIDSRVFRQFKKLKIENNIELRDYQLEAVEKARKRKRCMIQLPTGAGKTLVGIYLTAELRVPTVFYVHKKELLYQTMESYKKSLKFPQCLDCPTKSKKRTGKCERKTCPIGIVGDGKLNIKPITIAMVQSAGRLPHQLFDDFGMCVIDEAHHLGAETFHEIAINTKSEHLFGMTATPMREDGKDLMLWAGSGPIAYRMTISSLIRKEYLARPHIHAIRVKPIMFTRNAKWHQVYREAIVYNPDRNDQIALKARELSEYGSVYIHVKQIEHGDLLTNLINKRLLKNQTPAVFIHGSNSSKIRNATLDQFRKGDLPILVSTLLGEGVDLPNMYALILASGGLSRVLVTQVFGRLLRISKHDVVVFYDIADQCKYLYDHFLSRVAFYQSEDEFKLEEYLQNIITE